MQRVLLVDNDDSLRRALARMLQRAGFEVQAFGSAEALLDAGAARADACLVLDVDLPGASGPELKQALLRSGRDMPTVFITASAREDLAAQLAALSPVAVLHKPFGNEALIEALGRACAAHAPAGSGCA
jgi:FixJ family two-component response regulator